MKTKKPMAVILALILITGMAGWGGQSALAQTSGEMLSPETVSVFSVDNATIDAALYLDYAAGIEAGVYKWILSEDGDYYTLAAVDESGAPIESQESAINVGANNAELVGQMPMDGEGFTQPGSGSEGGPGGMGRGMMMPDGTIREVYFYCVDISEFTANKLGDRGSLSAKGIVTNVQDFIVTLCTGLGI